MAEITVDDLQPAEQLLVLCCRRCLSGCAAGPCVEMAWRLGCGDQLGAQSARAFSRMTRVLDSGARRPLQVAPPHAGPLSMDERSVLELVTACQCGAVALASGLARWLVRAPDHVALLAAASFLGRAMEQAGLSLRPPWHAASGT